MSLSKEDHNTMARLFKHGSTHQEIGDVYSVTRQRVHQILKRLGISRNSGGRTLAVSARNDEKARIAVQKCVDKYGCTPAQFSSICGHHSSGSKSAYRAFSVQRSHAIVRGVEWSLKFWDWHSIWRESGKWGLRGRGAGKYCMCRAGDEGAYAIGNVYIGTVVHNSALGRTLAYERPVRPSALRLVIQAAGGRKAVSESLNLPARYISQLANDGHIPRCWISSGRASSLSSLTCGAYTADDLAALCRPSIKKKAAK